MLREHHRLKQLLPKNSSKECWNLSNNSDKIKDIKHTFIPTPTVRNGFRRKKGDNPLVSNLNLKTKKEKNYLVSPILIIGLEL